MSEFADRVDLTAENRQGCPVRRTVTTRHAIDGQLDKGSTADVCLGWSKSLRGESRSDKARTNSRGTGARLAIVLLRCSIAAGSPAVPHIKGFDLSAVFTGYGFADSTGCAPVINAFFP